MTTLVRVSGGGVLLAALLAAGCAAAAAPRAGGPHSISEQELRKHVLFLASDEMLGRETGQSAIHRAEEYIAAKFASYGLEPLPGQANHFVDFEVYRRGYDPEQTFVATTVGAEELRGRPGIDVRPFDFSDSGSVEAPLVFAGYGITAPEHGWDDYDGLNVAGKLVLVLRHEPGEKDPESPFDGESSTRHALFTTKARLAEEHGAVGMLLVTDPLNHDPGDDLRLSGRLRLEVPEEDEQEEDAATDDTPFLAVHVSRDWVADAGLDLAELQRALEDGTGAGELAATGISVRVAVQERSEPEVVQARNVVGFLQGSDPTLKDKWIVVGGHHDHVGGYAGEGDTVFNGADDNASGTSGVLELAQAFAGLAEPPRRSLLFATFSGEEKGLLGSRAMVRQELIPIDKVEFMLNLDMIGRNPEASIDVTGDGFARGLREVVEAANAGIGLPLKFGGAAYSGNSDHDAFYDKGVPFMFFFSGIHEDYHQLGDHADKLAYGQMEQVVRLAYETLERLADADAAPTFIHHVTWLGIEVEVLQGSATVTAVEDDSRASRAGLRRGDVLKAFEEFKAIEPGTRTALHIGRGDETLTFDVERARTGFMGVSPGAPDEDQRKAHGLAEDEGVLLRQVTADGPSDKAGLEEGDILIRIAGRPVGLSSLRSRLAQIGAGERIDVMVIRDGERVTIEMTLGERPG